MQLLDTAEISGILDRPQLNGLSAAIQCFDDNTPLQSGDSVGCRNFRHVR